MAYLYQNLTYFERKYVGTLFFIAPIGIATYSALETNPNLGNSSFPKCIEHKDNLKILNQEMISFGGLRLK